MGSSGVVSEGCEMTGSSGVELCPPSGVPGVDEMPPPESRDLGAVLSDDVSLCPPTGCVMSLLAPPKREESMVARAISVTSAPPPVC